VLPDDQTPATRDRTVSVARRGGGVGGGRKTTAKGTGSRGRGRGRGIAAKQDSVVASSVLTPGSYSLQNLLVGLICVEFNACLLVQSMLSASSV
jgi:hypothetical protein